MDVTYSLLLLPLSRLGLAVLLLALALLQESLWDQDVIFGRYAPAGQKMLDRVVVLG